MTESGTDHAVTLTGLAFNTSYWAHISVNGTDDVIVWFNTSDVIDETPPDVLNLDANVLDDGRVTIAWYTSESATESIRINGDSVHEDAFATKKNHVFTTEVLQDGVYTLEVVSADASGNLNSSSLSFTVDAGTDVSDDDFTPGDEADDGVEPSSDVSNTAVQLVALIVVLLVLLAFLRVRGHEPGDNDPWQ